jgi:hypothetical protein
MAICGGGGGWCTKDVKGSYGVSLWKSIRQGWVCFLPFISYSVGSGDSVNSGIIIGAVLCL